jgi:hypothetical protein
LKQIIVYDSGSEKGKVGWGQGGEMNEALYAHMNNKRKNEKKTI